MIKRLGIALLTFVCVLSLTGCDIYWSEYFNFDKSDDSDTISEVAKNEPIINRGGDFPPGDLIKPDGDHYHWRIEYGGFPHMDGSRQLAPLAEAFARAQLPRPDSNDAQITYFTNREKAIDAFASARTVKGGFLDINSRNYIGLYDVEQIVFFADAPLDLLLVTDFSDDDRQLLGDVNAEQFARDGLVFIVASENPVEGISMEQLRAVLTGEITSWKELGGSDLPIALHLEPGELSGFLDRKILLGASLAENGLAEHEIPSGIPGGDSYTIMQPSAQFDYAAESLGLARWSDFNGKAKALAIDGVLPNSAAISAGEYPLTFGCYAVYRPASSDGGPGRFAKWMLSDEGKAVISDLGYIPEP